MLLVAILPITHDATNIRNMVAKMLPSVSLGYVTMPVEILCRTVIDIDIVAFITIYMELVNDLCRHLEDKKANLVCINNTSGRKTLANSQHGVCFAAI